MTNLDSILKSRDITLPVKVCLVKAMVFPVVMYGCEIWTIKKAERWGIAAFELWCWRRLLRVPWIVRRSNQSILRNQSWIFSGRTDAEVETPNPLATWCEELTHWKRPWCWEGLKVGGEGDDRRWDGWMASPTWWTWVWGGSGGWWWTGKPGVLWFMGSELDTTEWLNWTELTSPGTFLPSRRAWSAPTAALQIPFSWSLSGQISMPWQNFSLENEYKMQLVEKSVL